MARKFEITRTVKTTVVNAIIIDKETLEITEKSYYIFDEVKDTNKISKIITKMANDNGCQLVKIGTVDVEEQLYGITLADFLHYATPLKTRNGEIETE